MTPVLPVRLGIGVVICRDARYLLGLRRGSLGSGTWGFPGGHVEASEDPLAAARREAGEETGLILLAPRPAGWSRHVDADSQQRYVTLYVEAEAEGEPRCCEPDKCLEWRWWPRRELPSALFRPTAAYFER